MTGSFGQVCVWVEEYLLDEVEGVTPVRQRLHVVEEDASCTTKNITTIISKSYVNIVTPALEVTQGQILSQSPTYAPDSGGICMGLD